MTMNAPHHRILSVFEDVLVAFVRDWVTNAMRFVDTELGLGDEEPRPGSDQAQRRG